MTRSLRKQHLLYALAFALSIASFFASMTPAGAADAFWAGGTSNDWNTATNWSTGAVPDVSNLVRINNTTTYAPEVSQAGAQALGVLIGNNSGTTGELTVTGDGTLSATSI